MFVFYYQTLVVISFLTLKLKNLICSNYQTLVVISFLTLKFFDVRVNIYKLCFVASYELYIAQLIMFIVVESHHTGKDAHIFFWIYSEINYVTF